MARLSFRCDEELVQRVDAARDLIPREAWLRRAIERELDGPSDESLRRTDRMIRDGVRSSSQAKRNDTEARPLTRITETRKR